MPSKPPPLARRFQLSYAFHGMQERHQAVFKSIIRVLDTRLQHQWVQGDADADVMVLSESASAGGHDKISLQCGGGGDSHDLSLPLRAEALEETLNLLGHLIWNAAAQRSHAVADPRETQVAGTSRDSTAFAATMPGQPMG